MAGCDNVAAALRHLFAIWIEDPTADDNVVPGHGFLMEIGFNDCVERPGADDLVALRANIHWEKLLVALGIFGPMTRDLRGQRTRGPGIHNIRITDEAVRLPSD